MSKRRRNAEQIEAARAAVIRAQALAQFSRRQPDPETAVSLHYQRVVEISVGWVRETRAELPASKWDAKRYGSSIHAGPQVDPSQLEQEIGIDNRCMSEAEGQTQ